ncbi:hypothetical protein IPM65_00475 [Candidatus Roizmanbacteria bacterium]|nr:MAG: hypothetical protein IPM65_00475 [Candidatus Roizmanbacteria bacterium]
MSSTTIFAYKQPTQHLFPQGRRSFVNPYNSQYRHIKDRRFDITNRDQRGTPVDNIRDKSKRVLLHRKTVFPFKLFPVHVIVDIHRVVVIEKTFLFADTIRTIPIANIQYVRCDRALLFGSIRIRTYGFSDREVVVKFLWNKDALRLRRLIEGLIICYEDNVDPLDFKDEDLCTCLENLGQEHFG